MLGSFGTQRLVEDLELDPASWSPLATASWSKRQRSEMEWQKRVSYVRMGYRMDIPPEKRRAWASAWVAGGAKAGGVTNS